MSLTLTNVHETAKDPNTGLDRIVGHNPYLRLKDGDYPPIFIQRGQAYDESGNLIKVIPDWCLIELNKVDQKALASVGWKGLPTDKKPAPKIAKMVADGPRRRGKGKAKSLPRAFPGPSENLHTDPVEDNDDAEDSPE